MRLLVIGGVAAGLSAASRARRVDASLEIVVLEKGGVISYGACGLPYLVEGRVRTPEELIVYTPEYFARERNITVRTGARVESIQHGRREVVLAGGERVRYDRLVIATGARPSTARIAGADLPHVFTLHTMDDALRMMRFLDEKRPRRAVVIGAGYIGLEAADALRARGLEVTIFEAGANVLRREDPELTRHAAVHMASSGVALRLNAPVKAIEPDRVDDVACDMVVLAAGITPNAELAADAGIERGRTGAIRVDERMETNLPGVYAAGDCAEADHMVTGRPAYIPLGTTANKQGRVAGANAAGGRERFGGVTGTAILSLFGKGFAVTGLSAEQARREGFTPVAARIEGRSRAGYFDGRPTAVELVADCGTRRLVGGTVIGEDGTAGRINVIAAALQARMRVEDFENLDLAYAPPFAPVWDPLLIAAQQLSKALDRG
ncbi:MAG TPA: FAD-dependent oxidoreductase [Bryobacteraceae bacterium]|nr:FAD-dependent oxidoreductase [Bryobacteraceae bacterium]